MKATISAGREHLNKLMAEWRAIGEKLKNATEETANAFISQRKTLKDRIDNMRDSIQKASGRLQTQNAR